MEELGVDGRIILKWIFKNWDKGDVDWIDRAQDKDRWGGGLIKRGMNLRVA